jgi:hypothetical protein
LLAKYAESGAAIEDVNAVAQPHFDAGGIASIAHVLELWGRRRTAHTPELNPHRVETACEPGAVYRLYLETKEDLRQLLGWFINAFPGDKYDYPSQMRTSRGVIGTWGMGMAFLIGLTAKHDPAYPIMNGWLVEVRWVFFS